MKICRKIVAIGGGEIGRPGYPVETTAIDKEIIRLTGKKHPKLLFIPTASSDSSSYYETVIKHFGKTLRCKTDVLYLLNGKTSNKQASLKILGSDIVYVGGGNTLKMMKAWRKTGIDKILRKAYERGIVLSGVSAGSICWFKWGNSDSMKYYDPKAKQIKVSGMGLINALHCPHYNADRERQTSLKEMLKNTPGVSIALEDCCALEVVDNMYRIITSKRRAQAYKIYWNNNRYFKETIGKNGFASLDELLNI